MKIIKEKPKIKIPKRNIQKLNWGVAGCGLYLENTFLPALSSLNRSNLVAVYSKSRERADYIKSKFHGEISFTDFNNFLENPFDTLYISSVNSDHYWQVIEAAKKGKNILCEKPLALTSEQAEEMVKVCRENNIMLSVNYVNRFHPLVEKAKELISANKLGKIVSVTVNFNIDFLPNSNYRFKKELSGGGALWDLGTHMIDLLRYLGGEIVDIKGFTDNVIYQSEVEDFASALVKFENSGYGHMNVSYSNKKAFNRIEINGYKGSILIDNIFRKNTHAKLTIDIEGEPKIAFRKKANKQVLLLRSLQKAFMKKHPLLIKGNDGLVNLRLMEKLVKDSK